MKPVDNTSLDRNEWMQNRGRVKEQHGNSDKLKEELLVIKAHLKDLEDKNDLLQKQNKMLLKKCEEEKGNYAANASGLNESQIEVIIKEKNMAQEECNALKAKLNQLKTEQRNLPVKQNENESSKKLLELEAKYSTLSSKLVSYIK
eukprot:TRINITY_DN2984_c0_g7_i1.p1 TRINITY_DN2984_c0_g7~~TRINITY_DN2984_c0_g7_i1.p1  ORF type:complete len:146 (+),score=22.25 TRINITY_DN2984_c0_g7_i1:188-625(+)